MKFILFSLYLLILSTNPVHAATKTSNWLDSNEQNSQTIDHTTWQVFLQKYVNTDNDSKVKYAAVSNSDKQALNGYIDTLGSINPLLYKRAEQYAYWANLYNAITIKLILDHYPVKSIKKIELSRSFRPWSRGPWDDDVISINNTAISLNDIEHVILRPIWQDPRTHYAVNCASIGCPNLANQAFTAENTEQLLEQNASAFINSNKGLKYVGKNKVVLSKIYSWYKGDFGDTQAELIEHLKQYADNERLKALNNNPSIKYEYNWNLNDDK